MGYAICTLGVPYEYRYFFQVSPQINKTRIFSPAALPTSEATVHFFQVPFPPATFWSLEVTEMTKEQGIPLRAEKALLTKET